MISPSSIKETLLLKQNYVKIELKVSPHDLCVLPGNQLLSVNCDEYNLTIYDEKFQLIKTIQMINDENIQPYAVMLNDEKNRFYIVDWIRTGIIMTDLDFNQIKSIGSRGVEEDQFQIPFSGCFSNSRLYVCDSQNQRIKIYTADLELVKIIKVDYNPSFMKIIGDTACVTDNNLLYFYNLGDFNLKKKYDQFEQIRISELDSFFYGFEVFKKTINCFDVNGDLIEVIKLHDFDFDLGFGDTVLVKFKNDLLLKVRYQQLLVKFNLVN